MNDGIVVIGAGGHAKVCLEIIQTMGEKAAYCIGTDPSVGFCLGVPVIHGDDKLSVLKKKGFSKAFVAIGRNDLREKLGVYAESLGYKIINVLSPYALISSSVQFGRGVAVMPGAIINADSIIDNYAIVNSGSIIEHDCHIKNSVHIGPRSALAGNVKVGSYSFLGVGSNVIPCVSIGDEVIVGAGSVVIRDVQSNQTVVGIPAKTLIGENDVK